MDSDFVEINWSLSLHWLKAAEHPRQDSEGPAGMPLGWPPPGCGWVPEACYPTPWPEPEALCEPGPCGRLLGPGARAASAIRIDSSPRLRPVGCCFLLGWEELSSYCVFSRIYSYSRAGAESEPSHPQCHSTTPGRMASESSLGRSCPPPCWKEGQAGPTSLFCTTSVGTGWGHSTGGRGWAGAVPSLTPHTSPGRYPGSSFRERAWESFLGSRFPNGQCSAELRVFFFFLFLLFNLFCRAAWNPRGCCRPCGARELCSGSCP